MSEPVNPRPNCCSVCTGDTSCNIWFEPGPPGFPGKCKLDLLTYDQVYAVLQRVPQAKADLMRITNDPCLLALARETSLIEPQADDDQRAADRINANPLPYYTFFRGNIYGDIIAFLLMLSTGRVFCALHDLLSHAY
jgi:hypothetical protein